ncbi:kinase-like domain-containing protein [Pilobolus umbonatus]|nr:kinase-like domain-containing protein [Pilobolus umbonatus]
MRNFIKDDGKKITIHYFSANHMDVFVRSVYAIKSINSTLSPSDKDYTIRSLRAIVLNRPTPNMNYQYIWITSPIIPEKSLYYLSTMTAPPVDIHDSEYKIWSIYSLLKAVEALQSHKFVHMAISPKSFYYDDTTETHWKLANFGYVQQQGVALNRGGMVASSTFTAPEILIFLSHSTLSGGPLMNVKSESDIWSLGCVIYTVITGGKELFESEEQLLRLSKDEKAMIQHTEAAFKDVKQQGDIYENILRFMLQLDPKNRKSMLPLVELWETVHNIPLTQNNQN